MRTISNLVNRLHISHDANVRKLHHDDIEVPSIVQRDHARGYVVLPGDLSKETPMGTIKILLELSSYFSILYSSAIGLRWKNEWCFL